ncbi:hypothetical protein QBC39DRAFT_336713 [Podospora conica]|nr:hypothetical protein QBC39DRAFT_336713 [Schizothecium conicum]
MTAFLLHISGRRGISSDNRYCRQNTEQVYTVPPSPRAGPSANPLRRGNMEPRGGTWNPHAVDGGGLEFEIRPPPLWSLLMKPQRDLSLTRRDGRQPRCRKFLHSPSHVSLFRESLPRGQPPSPVSSICRQHTRHPPTQATPPKNPNPGCRPRSGRNRVLSGSRHSTDFCRRPKFTHPSSWGASAAHAPPRASHHIHRIDHMGGGGGGRMESSCAMTKRQNNLFSNVIPNRGTDRVPLSKISAHHHPPDLARGAT